MPKFCYPSLQTCHTVLCERASTVAKQIGGRLSSSSSLEMSKLQRYDYVSCLCLFAALAVALQLACQPLQAVHTRHVSFACPASLCLNSGAASTYPLFGWATNQNIAYPQRKTLMRSRSRSFSSFFFCGERSRSFFRNKTTKVSEDNWNPSINQQSATRKDNWNPSNRQL
jgi:hypothetical protein